MPSSSPHAPVVLDPAPPDALRDRAATRSLPLHLVARAFERGADAVLCLDRASHCTYLNARAAELLGGEPRALLGRVPWDARPELAEGALHATVRQAMTSGESAVLQPTNAPWHRRFELRIEPFDDGLMIVATRLPGAPTEQAQLIEQSRYLRAVLDTAPECVKVLGRDGSLLDMNAAGLAMVDAPSLAALRAHGIGSLIAAEHRPDFHRLHDAALHGTSGRLEFGVVTMGGRHRRFETHAAPLRDARGTVMGVLAVTRDVTERRAAEEKLRESEAFSRLLLEASPDCIKVLDLDGRVEHVNGPGLALLEATDRDALHGRRWSDLWCGEPQAQARAAVAAARAGGSARFQAEAPTLRGTQKHWDVTVTPVRDDAGTIVRLLATAREITESKRAEERLRESESHFRELTEGAPLGVFLNDAAGTTIYVNQRCADIIGTSREALLGGGWKRSVHPDDAARVTSERQAFRAGDVDRRSFEYRVRRVDGSTRSIVAHIVRLHGVDGRSEGFVGMVEDTTDRLALEAQLRQAQKMEAVGQLAGGIAHDFNNLLTVISGSLELAREDLAPLLPAGHPSHGDLAEIAQAAERARALVRQLLAFSRKQVVVRQAVDVNAVVRGADQLLRRVIGDEVVLRTRLADDVLVVRADAVQLEQVLVNLALNARDAMLTPAHGTAGIGGVLALTTDALVLDAADAGAWPGLAPGAYVRVVVRDSGHGMDGATRAHLFEPFFTTKPVGAGTGLGLATVYGIVQQAGGVVHVESAPGAGATFTILLPRQPQADASSPTLAGPPSEAASGVGRGTVLLVEDEAAVRATTRRILERHGYAVLEARHGADALLLWRAHRAEVTAVVTDLRMPEMGGRELIARLREQGAALPVVFVSGYSDETASPERAPAERALEKPFTGEALLQALDAARTRHADR